MRLPLHRASEPRAIDLRDATPRVHSSASVVLVALDEPSVLAFAARCATTLVALGARPSLVLESDANVDAAVPVALRIDGATVARVPTLTDSLSATWNDAFDASEPLIAIGASFVPLLRANSVIAIGSGSLVSARFRSVRSAIDAVLFESRPAFADWLAGRLARRS